MNCHREVRKQLVGIRQAVAVPASVDDGIAQPQKDVVFADIRGREGIAGRRGYREGESARL